MHTGTWTRADKLPRIRGVPTALDLAQQDMTNEECHLALDLNGTDYDGQRGDKTTPGPAPTLQQIKQNWKEYNKYQQNRDTRDRARVARDGNNAQNGNRQKSNSIFRADRPDIHFSIHHIS